MLVRWVYASIATGVLTGFAFLLVTGSYSNDGPAVLKLTPERGLHTGDIFVLAGWAAGVLAVLLLTVQRRPDAAGHP